MNVTVKNVLERVGEGTVLRDSEMGVVVRNAYYYRLDEADHDRILEIVKRFDACHYPEKKGLGIKGLGKSGVLELLAKLGIWLNAADGAQEV